MEGVVIQRPAIEDETGRWTPNDKMSKRDDEAAANTELHGRHALPYTPPGADPHRVSPLYTASKYLGI